MSSMFVVLDPKKPFVTLELHLRVSGWRQLEGKENAYDLERAVFERKPNERLVYTHDPALGLRFIECPPMTKVCEGQLGRVTVKTVRQWIEDKDEVTQVRGLKAAGLMADPDLLGAVEARLNDPRAPVAQAAASVVPELRKHAAAHEAELGRNIYKEVARMAGEAFGIAEDFGIPLDGYGEENIPRVEQVLAKIVPQKVNDKGRTLTIQRFGCYLLEVARRRFGGRYDWSDRYAQPALIIGEPVFAFIVLTWDRVKDRLSGDTGANLPFWWDGFEKELRGLFIGESRWYV